MRIDGDYHSRKRETQRRKGYSEADIEESEKYPSETECRQEVEEIRGHKQRFFDQIFYLILGENYRSTDAEIKVNALEKLLRLDKGAMGTKAVTCIKRALSYWSAELQAAGGLAKGGGSTEEETRGYEPRFVCLGGRTFASHLAEQGWIKIPQRCEGQETLPTATINHIVNFPSPEKRTLQIFAATFGFYNVEDTDKDGKNILHHLYSATKYCALAGHIAVEMFSQHEGRMPGDYKKAMSQTVTGEKPFGWTPLHILLHNSDILMVQRDIVERLLDNDIVDISAFDATTDSKVIVFFFL